ncbi:MAG: hypothetical protein ABSF08_08795 [Candidatus Cybelea sp.]|jgi:hypothetical protein
MPKPNPSTLLVERLRTYCSERRSLGPLLARYRTFLDMRQFNDARTALEREVAAIFASGLPFNEEGRRYNIPQAEHVTVAAFNLRLAFTRPELQDNPSQVWEYGSPVPGVLTTGWHPAVKQRLLDLVGPAEFTLERMLTA